MTREEAIKEAYGIPVNKKQHEALQILIPELTESEDERIIKLIRSLLENARAVQSNTSLYKQYDDALAWLEKQKEQKPDSLIYDKDLDKAAREFYLSGGADSPVDSTGLVPIVRMAEFGATWMKERMEKEQKSSIFPPGLGEVRWNPISSIQQKPVTKINGEPISAENQSVDIPLVELSEKEIEHLYTLASYIKSSGYEDDGEFLEGVADKLKSLRSSWKPSEEQMEALKECGECKRCIKELYENLQKRYGTC